MLNKVTGASSGRNLKIKSIIMETEWVTRERWETYIAEDPPLVLLCMLGRWHLDPHH